MKKFFFLLFIGIGCSHNLHINCNEPASLSNLRIDAKDKKEATSMAGGWKFIEKK